MIIHIMKNSLKQVEEFQQVTNQIVNASPQLVDPKIAKLRYDIMIEEVNEYKDAVEKGDIVEIFDSLIDQLYVLLGTFNTHGLQHKLEEGFQEVHRSNMSKLDSNGKPIYQESGKVGKSKHYSPPKLDSILNM